MELPQMGVKHYEWDVSSERKKPVLLSRLIWNTALADLHWNAHNLFSTTVCLRFSEPIHLPLNNVSGIEKHFITQTKASTPEIKR